MENHCPNEYRFFWKSNDDAFTKDKAMWTPYSQPDSNYLEECYRGFIKGEGVKPKIGDYEFDFNFWMQIHSIDRFRQRPILREKPAEVQNMILKNRFSNMISECAICMDMPRSVIFAPCGHLLCCEIDAQKLMDAEMDCPICRQKIESLVKKVFNSNPAV